MPESATSLFTLIHNGEPNLHTQERRSKQYYWEYVAASRSLLSNTVSQFLRLAWHHKGCDPCSWPSCSGGSATEFRALERERPLLLPVLQAAYKGRVGLDAGALALDKVKGEVVAHVVGVDEVRDDDGGRARDSLETLG